MEKEINTGKNGKSLIGSYLILWFVVFTWGISPLLNKYMFNNYVSPVIYAVALNTISIVTLTIICRKKLRFIDKGYLKIAIPTGLANGLASLLQKIGLQYTTPAQYAFLENLSCVLVPVLVFIFIRKRPNIYKILASILCLVGAFIMSGLNFQTQSISFGKGEILCGMAGLLYGVNIAMTGIYAKNLDSGLYVLLHETIAILINLPTAIVLGTVSFNGKIIEPMRFTWGFVPVLLILFVSLVINTLCWNLRTSVAKKIDPTVIGVIMPFSAVITTIISVIAGMDMMTLNLGLGATISLVAVLLSTFGEYVENKKDNSQKGQEITDNINNQQEHKV